VVTLRHFGDGIEVELLDSDAPFDPTVEMAAAHAVRSSPCLRAAGVCCCCVL
jgi:hypothetical protein